MGTMELPKPKIAPSMLSSDFANLASEAKFIENCGADWLHMDIMVRSEYLSLDSRVWACEFRNKKCNPDLTRIW